MPVSVPDHFADGLIESLGLDPATIDADARQRFTRLLNNEVEIAANDHHRDVMATARAETMDCLHGPVRPPTPGDPGRPGGLDGRFAGPLALVRALVAEIERLRALQPEQAPDEADLDSDDDTPADETREQKIARYSEALDFVLSPEWLPWYEHHRPDLMARLRGHTKTMLAREGRHPAQIHPADAPVPPHRHLNDHDPREWTPECCACQHQSGDRDFVDETCAACCAIRDGYRAYTRREFAVRHPSGVVEDRVPEGMARRGVTKHPEQTLLVRERIVTPDVVGPYVEIPVETDSAPAEEAVGTIEVSIGIGEDFDDDRVTATVAEPPFMDDLDRQVAAYEGDNVADSDTLDAWATRHVFPLVKGSAAKERDGSVDVLVTYGDPTTTGFEFEFLFDASGTVLT